MPPLQRVLLHQGRPYGAPVQLALNSDHVPPVINKGCQCDSQGGRLRVLANSPMSGVPGVGGVALPMQQSSEHGALCEEVAAGVWRQAHSTGPAVIALLPCSRITPVCMFVPCCKSGGGAVPQLDCPTVAACQQQECGHYSGRSQHACLSGTLACAETVSLGCCCVWWAAGVPAAVTS